MARLVLDTNSLIQCVAHRSPYHELWVTFLDGRNNLCVTTDMLEEYAEILERKTSSRFAELTINVIVNNPCTVFVTPFYRFNVIISDPDDNKFVDCAVAGRAKFIVTDDRHFNVLKDLTFPQIDILRLDEAMKVLT